MHTHIVYMYAWIWAGLRTCLCCEKIVRNEHGPDMLCSFVCVCVFAFVLLFFVVLQRPSQRCAFGIGSQGVQALGRLQHVRLQKTEIQNILTLDTSNSPMRRR